MTTAPNSSSATWMNGDFTTYPAHPRFKVGSASIDVTRMVQAWAKGTVPNYGFVFRGTNETMGASDNNSCVLNFGPSPTLSIEAY